MNAEAIIAISASIVALTQLVKWAGLRDHYGPIMVLLLSAFGTVFWGWAEGEMTRMNAFSYFAGWVAVSLNAAGVYGFTRASADAVARMTPPPGSGAGSEPTIKQ